ncbi:CVNH domain-containing protein [Collimonas arenae]|uniref:CVNH domain-containing protein n=1 Tax=Collimonas arenae TaxID=279058 RepID=UPI000A9E1BFD|nr:CVNH domain-containing protein [Collimonas arenae]
MTVKSVLAVIACGVFAACAASPYGDSYNSYQPAAQGYFGNAPAVAYGGYSGYGDAPSYGDRYGGGDNWTPPGSYRDSCRDIVVRRGMLEATCGGNNGGRRTSIPLSSCRSGSFENINGNLQCMGGGGRDYGQSSRDVPREVTCNPARKFASGAMCLKPTAAHQVIAECNRQHRCLPAEVVASVI